MIPVPANQELTSSERSLISALTRPDVEVQVVIPDDIDRDRYFKSLSAACRGYARATAAAEKLFPILGRLLVVAQEHPELYTSAGYETFEAFVDFVGDTYGAGRTTCYQAKQFVSRWGKQVTAVGDFEAVGRVKFHLISKAVPKGDEGKGTAKKLIEIARTGTTEDLRTYIEEKLHISRSSTIRGGIFRVECSTKKRQARIEKFFANEKIHSYCETENVDEILEHMIEECETEWLRHVEEATAGAE